MRLLVVAMLAVGCTPTTAETTSPDAAAVVTIGDCKVPAALAQTDRTGGQCGGAARAALSCTSSTRSVLCLSDDVQQCPTGDPNIGAGPWTCQNFCGPSEFGILCGAILLAPQADNIDPPPGCRAVAPTPAGPTFYCCGCGA